MRRAYQNHEGHERREGHERLAERELDLEAYQHSNRLAEARAGDEAELPGGLDGFLIQTEDRVERARHLEIADGAVGQHDTFELDHPLHFRAHRFRGVVGTHAAQQPRRLDAIAGTVDAAAGAAAAAFTQTRALPVADAGTGACAGAAVGARALRRRVFLRFDQARRRLVLGAQRDRGNVDFLLFRRLDVGKRDRFRRFLDRYGQFFLARQLGLLDWLFLLIAPAAATAARARFREPDNRTRRPVQQHGVASRLGRKPNQEQDYQEKRSMREHRRANRAAEPLFLLLEHEMDFARPRGGADVEVSLSWSAFRRALRCGRGHYGDVCLVHSHRACSGTATAKGVPQQRLASVSDSSFGCASPAFGLAKERTNYVSLHVPTATGDPPLRISTSRAVSTGGRST